jgi:serine/threonine protein kinase
MYTAATVGLGGSIDPTWTPEFQSFLSLCLKVNPEDRASADQLLEHAFLQKTDTRQTMETILTSIFLHRSLGNSGMFG